METRDPKKDDPRRASAEKSLAPFVFGSLLVFALQLLAVVLLLVGLVALIR